MPVDDSGMTDAALLERLARGEPEALGAVFDRHASAVTRYAWALASDRRDVEELVQDTFLTAWRRGASIPQESLLPWLLVTCRNHALNLQRLRAKHRADELRDDLLSTSGIGVEGGGDDARDQLRWVMAEIEKLPAVDRRVCELCLIEGRSYAEAAEQLGLTVGAVKQRVLRSRTRLRKVVTDDEN
ncbi:RNA polymerase sigma factor [Herbiconiux sp. UC225_62]|uniref:RNA polymerase sigma factor n=1 Tax=Herbiconiux sp. UC225_62 TaxID=3350168 RepID=UPI0036D34FA3